MNFALLPLPLWGYAVVALVSCHITIIAVTIYLHRHQAHHALSLHPIVSHFFRGWLWLTTGMTTRVWVAIHRKHHAYSDLHQDPHSPRHHGIRKVLLEGAELYRVEARNADTLRKYGHSTPQDWIERHVYATHERLGIIIMLVVDLVLFGPIGLTVWAVQMIWIPFFAAGVINGMGHHFGYRSFVTDDASRNIVPWGILIGGEELHNNHHAHVRSARLSNRWWEFDIGWFYIRILEHLGLARVRSVAPAIRTHAANKECDERTLMAIVTHRHDILKQYARAMAPIARTELVRLHAGDPASCDPLRLLDPERSRPMNADTSASPSESTDTADLMGTSELLRTIANMRADLSGLWTRSPATPAQLVDDLNDWCARAERSGIDTLRRFSLSLRTRTLASPPLS